MGKILVKKFNILLTFTFTSIGDSRIVKRIFNRFCDGSCEDITKEFHKSLEITRSFFKIRDSYQKALENPAIGKAKFPIIISYERRGEKRQISEETQPFVIISGFPLDIGDSNKKVQLISLSWLFSYDCDKDLDDATDLSIAITHLLWGASAKCKKKESNETQSNFELCKYVESELLSESIKISNAERSFAIALGVKGLSKESVKDREPLETASRQIYGMLYSDEGWKEVPNSYAVKNLKDISWSTRWFFKFFVSPTSMLLLCENENRCTFDELVLEREDHKCYMECSQNVKQFPILWHGFFITFEWSNISRQVYRIAKQVLAYESAEVRQIAAGIGEQSIKGMDNKIRNIIRLAQWAEEKKEMLGEGIVGVPEIGNVTRILRERFQILALGEQLKHMSEELESMSTTVHNRMIQRKSFNRDRYYKITTITFAIISLFLAITSASGSLLVIAIGNAIINQPSLIVILVASIMIPILLIIVYLHSIEKKRKSPILFNEFENALS